MIPSARSFQYKYVNNILVQCCCFFVCLFGSAQPRVDTIYLANQMAGSCRYQFVRVCQNQLSLRCTISLILFCVSTYLRAFGDLFGWILTLSISKQHFSTFFPRLSHGSINSNIWLFLWLKRVWYQVIIINCRLCARPASFSSVSLLSFGHFCDVFG